MAVWHISGGLRRLPPQAALNRVGILPRRGPTSIRVTTPSRDSIGSLIRFGSISIRDALGRGVLRKSQAKTRL